MGNYKGATIGYKGRIIGVDQPTGNVKISFDYDTKDNKLNPPMKATRHFTQLAVNRAAISVKIARSYVGTATQFIELRDLQNINKSPTVGHKGRIIRVFQKGRVAVRIIFEHDREGNKLELPYDCVRKISLLALYFPTTQYEAECEPDNEEPEEVESDYEDEEESDDSSKPDRRRLQTKRLAAAENALA